MLKGIAAALAAAGAVGIAMAAGVRAAEAPTLSVPAVVSAVRPSVVAVMTRGIPPNPYQPATSPGSGSGIIIDGQGYILTNQHLVTGNSRVVIGLSSGRLVPGRVTARDFLLDLAIIHIDAKDLVVASLGREQPLQIGETVVAIGHPLKGGSTVTTGVVSGLDRSILAPNGESLFDLIQTDAAINAGNSGGPLVDLNGRIVGMNAAVAPAAQGIGYAISMDAVLPHIKSMLVRGAVMRPDLGFVPVTVTASVAASFHLDTEFGVLAVQIEPNNVAAQSGLQNGDVILAVDNTPIYNTGDFWHAFLRPGEELPAQLTVYGKQGQLTVALPRTPLRTPAR